MVVGKSPKIKKDSAQAPPQTPPGSVCIRQLEVPGEVVERVKRATAQRSSKTRGGREDCRKARDRLHPVQRGLTGNRARSALHVDWRRSGGRGLDGTKINSANLSNITGLSAAFGLARRKHEKARATPQKMKKSLEKKTSSYSATTAAPSELLQCYTVRALGIPRS